MGIFGDVPQDLQAQRKAWLDQQLQSGAITQAQYDDAMRASVAVTQAADTGGPSPGQLPGPAAETLDNSGMYGPNAKSAIGDPVGYKMAQMHLGALGLQAYRPDLEQSRLNALQQQLGAFRPMNNVLASMYGPGMTQNLMAQSPLVPGQTSIGAPNTRDIGLQAPPPPTPPQQPQGQPVSALLRLLQGR